MVSLPHFFFSKGWKLACIVILLYVFIGGMLVPLNTGILSVNPYTVDSAGVYTFQVNTYNARLDIYGKEMKAWLKCQNKWLAVPNIHIDRRDHFSFSLSFDSVLLQSLPGSHFDLLINTSYAGNVILRDAIVLHERTSILTGRMDNSALFSEPVVQHNKSTSFTFPFREILFESIRNTFFHVPMWFAMLFLITGSLIYSIRYLYTLHMRDDLFASSFATVAIVFAACGLITGMIWARHTWGSWWPNDPKLNGAAIGVAVYLAYGVLRSSVSDEIKRARISAVYNIFAFVIYILFIFIMPRITDSLHPGNGGNPAFSKYDLDSHLRLFFYPAVIGWILLSAWITTLLIRIQNLENEKV